MKNVLIPFALVNNVVKSIKDISKYDDAYCLECGEKLILKNGDKNIKHLAHKHNSTCIFRKEIDTDNQASFESYTHKYAKDFIKDNIKYFRRFKKEIIIKDGEFKLGGYEDIDVLDIKVEYRGLKKDLNLESDYIPDLLLYCKDRLIALEIYKTNKKDYLELKEKLYKKNIDVYEVNINNVKDFTIDEVFKNTSLVFSDLKCEFENALQPIRQLHSENFNLKLENSKLKSENDSNLEEIDKLNVNIKQIRNTKNDLEKNLEQLKRKFNNIYFQFDKAKIRAKVELRKEMQQKDKITIKCRSKCVKVWYSEKFNKLLTNDLNKCDRDSEEYELIKRFKMRYNGLVGVYTNNGWDYNLKRVADIEKTYIEHRKYLGVDNEYLEEILGL